MLLGPVHKTFPAHSGGGMFFTSGRPNFLLQNSLGSFLCGCILWTASKHNMASTSQYYCCFVYTRIIQA